MSEPLEYESITRPASIPPALRAVAVLFVVLGAFSLIEMVLSVVTGKCSLNVGVLGIFVGRGLLRLMPGWRTCGLVFLWIGMIIAGLLMIAALGVFGGAAKTGGAGIRLSGGSVRVIWAAMGVGLFAISFWQYRVLTRPDVRRLFEQNEFPHV